MKWIINLLKSLFDSFKEAPIVIEITPEIKKPIEPKLPTGKKKIALLVGHGAGDSGAIFWNKVEEHKYNSDVAEIIKSKVKNHEIKVFYKSKGGWGPTYAQVAIWNPDISIEMHCNAASGTAVGCEVLITSESARTLGESFASALCGKFNRKMRGSKGIKWLKSGDRGFLNVYSMSKIAKKAILVEPFFCDNKAEHIEVVEYAEFFIGFIEAI